MSKVISIRKKADSGNFVISLDFELYWGMHDVYKVEEYEENIYGAHLATKEILKLFSEYNIEATWAVVGMMNFKTIDELKANIPSELPNYETEKLSAYYLMNQEYFDSLDVKLLFAPELIRLIEATPGQELGSHTFSHYYVLEKGQSRNAFKADAELFSRTMNTHINRMESIIFPRNQINQDYLTICHDMGFLTYRGNEKGWIYHIKENDRQNYFKRGLRLIDMYVNLFGYQSYPKSSINESLLLNVKSSRQLKPVSKSLKKLEHRRLKRILNSMTHAAKKGEIYHLWWHPHNFGVQLNENLAFLREILEHYQQLKEQYNFQSINMRGVAFEHTGGSSLEEVIDEG